ncbi:uncharacterized protein LOC110118017 [Ceratitis capitata]|uniref:uncharacterized protein LOC110118017 n=1 Tax=Ceratitis capitata TaxID=7213 RepID=UPI000A11F4CC|nr:uncharacterized protein LOC110118017 [Ceratitis capitata]
MPKSQNFGKRRLCCRTHSMRFCRAFIAMTPEERYESAKAHRYCLHGLATFHTTGACDSPDSCRRCGLGHHTMLHRSGHDGREGQPRTLKVTFRPGNTRRTKQPSKATQQPRSAKSPRLIARQSARRTVSRNPPAVQQRIRGLVKRARETLKQLEDLVEVSSPQARRHVEHMDEDDLIIL